MALEIHHLTQSNYKVMPWKNGGGTTTELSIFPLEATVQSGFDWRISLADLEGSGPFSLFPGFDRVIAQISGEPMVLKHEGKPYKLLERLEPYSFSGEWVTENVLHGKAQDLNVMVRRELFHAEAETLRFDNDAIRRIHEGGTTFIWVAFGSLAVHESSKGHDHRLDAHHALEVRGAQESVLSLKPRESDTTAFYIRIR